MCLLNFDILKLFLNSLYAIMFQCILCGLFKLKNHQYPIVYKPNAAKAGHVIYMQPAHPQTQPQPHWGWDKMDVILQTTFSNPFCVNENHSNWIQISLKFIPGWQYGILGSDNSLAPNIWWFGSRS